jgi:hypothetical protein
MVSCGTARNCLQRLPGRERFESTSMSSPVVGRRKPFWSAMRLDIAGSDKTSMPLMTCCSSYAYRQPARPGKRSAYDDRSRSTETLRGPCGRVTRRNFRVLVEPNDVMRSQVHAFSIVNLTSEDIRCGFSAAKRFAPSGEWSRAD